jgi:hypothetical protein
VTSEGPSSHEAAKRVARAGPNELSSGEQPTLIASALAIA